MRITMSVLVLALCAAVAAQEPLRFEAATIKPSQGQSPARGPRGPNLFTRERITLRLLMVYAWDLPAHRITGGPAWLDTDQFDVLAKANGSPTIPQMRALARDLLTERFGLRLHRETRDTAIYNLVLARADGRLGPNLKPAEIDCTPFMTGQRPMSESPLVTLGNGSEGPRCGVTSFASGPGGSMTATLNGFNMARLADYFERSVNRVVIDKTGLRTAFDVQVTFVNEAVRAPGGGVGDGPSLSTAVQEQLGLKLESSRGPAEFLVIDAAEKPAAN